MLIAGELVESQSGKRFGGLWYSDDTAQGGYKASGIGRQNGLEGFEQYLETNSVAWLR
jgi:aldehyde dehydrogenase (NAD+)